MALYIEDWSDILGIHPMIGAGFVSLLILPITLLMPETLGKGIKN